MRRKLLELPPFRFHLRAFSTTYDVVVIPKGMLIVIERGERGISILFHLEGNRAVISSLEEIRNGCGDDVDANEVVRILELALTQHLFCPPLWSMR